MPTSTFFTILHKYFECCFCKCCNVDKTNEETTPSSFFIYNSSEGDNSPFSFDDMSNPSTPITLSSSSSSLDSYNIQNKPYKRKNINIGIIPSYYYD
jgi:hypothetical protein